MMNLKNYHWLLLVLIFAVALRLIFFTGSTTSDELAYYSYANDAVNNKFELLPDHFSSRMGLIYGQAFLYKIFGINEFTSNLLPLIASLLGIILIFYTGKLLFNEKIGLLSAFLLSFYPLDVIYSTRLLPDLPAAFFMALSAFFFLKAERSSPKKNIFLLISGIALGIAYLIKELSLILVLFFVLYALYRRKIVKNYAFIFVGVLLFLIIEFVYAYVHTGNPLYRYFAIESQEVYFMRTFYYSYFTLQGLLSRLFFHYPYFMLSDVHYGSFFIFVIMAVFYFIINRNKNTNILLLWFFSIFFYLNFGTVSFYRYVPIGVTDRFLVMITFPSILLLSNFIVQKNFIRSKLTNFIILFLFLTSLGFIYVSKDRSQINEIKEAHEFLIKNRVKLVYTDERTSSVLKYLSGYKNIYEIKEFQKYDTLNFDPDADKNIFVLDMKKIEDANILVNLNMIKSFTKSYKNIRFPYEVSNPPSNWKLEKEFGSYDKKIKIYST